MSTDYDVLDKYMSEYRQIHHLFFKIVVDTEEDFVYAQELHSRYGDRVEFVLQPCNDDVITPNKTALLQKTYELSTRVVESKTMNNVRVLPQLHVLLEME
jgi:7-carboxy-7-deazaguanine synthase